MSNPRSQTKSNKSNKKRYAVRPTHKICRLYSVYRAYQCFTFVIMFNQLRNLADVHRQRAGGDYL